LSVAGVLGFALASSLVVLHPASSASNERNAKVANKSPSANLLPIKQVVLFNSGVGYFQREGIIDGNQRVDLSFPVQDINDLIKSLVVRDADGGQITGISYDSNAPIERTLKSFAVNLSGNPTFAQILTQAKGEKVEVALQQQGNAQPATLTGQIITVETKKVVVGKDIVEVECLNLWCADGMRSVKLADVLKLRFLNALMDSEFKKALETLALGHDTQKKAVSISFAGEGKRRVKVGYVIENPIWKTSYRLVLGSQDQKVEGKGEKKAEKPFLQGWAVVENPTDEDWSDVRMALVSGRPISFQMNLYDPLYITRPVVEPELFASLRPPTFSGGFTNDMDAKKFGGKAAEGKERGIPLRDRKPADNLARELQKSVKSEIRTWTEGDEQLKLNEGVASAATGTKLGDFFQYGIDHAVTLPRQKSALLPIVNQEVEGQRVSIYNERTHPKFPLLGLVFKNTTGMHLTQGPITVFEGSNYAGDARILDLQKGEQRLLAYAIDLGTEVQAIPSSDSGRYTLVKLNKGLVESRIVLKETKTYKAVNRGDSDRDLIVEHPNRTDFTLTSKDKPWESAADVHRFKVKVQAGKTAELAVSEEKTVSTQTSISNLDDDQIRFFINQPATSQKVKDALKKAIELRGKLALVQRDIQLAQKQLQDISVDQARLRQNIREVPQDSEAYKRYVKKFDAQETEIENLREKIKSLQNQEHEARKAFEAYLSNLTVE
jgi:hypothetical protein